MDAPCEIQGSIHVFRLVNNMCPGKWVHIIAALSFFVLPQLNIGIRFPLPNVIIPQKKAVL